MSWLFDADFWTKVATALSAALGLVTAIVTLLKTRTPAAEPQRAAIDHGLRLLSLGSKPSKSSSSFWLKCLVIISGILNLPMLAAGVWLLIADPSVLAVLPVIFFGGMAVALFVGARRLWVNPERGSAVKREVTINVQGQFDQIWDACIAALKRMKVGINTLDAKQGLISGETGLNWRSWGEIVEVQITVVGPNECAVHVKSDCRMTTTLVDYGKNSSNIRQFLRELMR